MSRYKSLIISFSIILCFSVQNVAQSSAITVEISKLKELQKALSPSDNDAVFASQFKDVETDLAVNRLFASLYKLQNVWLGVASFYYNEKKSLVVKDNLLLLETEWKRAGAQLNAKEKRFSPIVINKLPALVRAIIQASRNRSRPLYQSSILYAKNTNPNQGLYYIGNAQANIDLALFNQSLRFQTKKMHLKFVSLDAELTQLEREIIESYRTSAPEEQTRYNAINSALKLAQELNERVWFEGAMLKYLDVTVAFALLKNPSVNSNEIPALKAKLDEKVSELTKNNFDQSIGIAFLEIAQGLLANDKSSEADLKRAKVILDEVLPKYQKKFKGSK